MKKKKRKYTSKQNDAYTDDCTIAEFLKESNDPDFKPPYKGKSVLKYFLGKKQ